jgi:hypothetical protein
MFGHCRVSLPTKFSNASSDILQKAISDLPAVCFAKELIEAYTEAKVILSTRDVDSWHHSVATTINGQVRNYPLRFIQLFHPLMFQFTVFNQIYYYFFRQDF